MGEDAFKCELCLHNGLKSVLGKHTHSHSLAFLTYLGSPNEG